MYAATYSANQYKAQSVATSPQQLVVMCYDGMVIFLEKVRGAIQRKEIEKKMKFINKTIAIIEELQSSLNFEKGGEIAKNLDRIYDYFLYELMMIGRNEEIEKLDHVIKLVKELQSAWVKVAAEPISTNSSNYSGVALTG